MKRISMIAAAALAACLGFGTGDLRAAQDSIPTAAPATKTASQKKAAKKKTEKKTPPAPVKADSADTGIVAFSDTSDIATDTVGLGQNPANVIPLNGPNYTKNMEFTIDNPEHFARTILKTIKGFILVLFLLFGIPVLFLIIVIYLIYRANRKKKPTGQAASPVRPQPAGAPVNEVPLQGSPEQAAGNQATNGPSAYAPATPAGGLKTFQGWYFDESIMASGIKYVSVGLGISLASLITGGARGFFVWIGIVILFIGIGKILIALLPTLRQGRRIHVEQETGTPEQEKPAQAGPETAAPKPHTEKAEDYMPSDKKEGNAPEE